MGGVEKGGEEKFMNDITSQEWILDPHHLVRFAPSGVAALSPCNSACLTRPEALLDRSINFLEGAFFGTFSSPRINCTPPPIPQAKALIFANLTIRTSNQLRVKGCSTD